MNTVERIIEKFGGQSALAALLGKHQSTVQYWAKTGRIPPRWHGQLLQLAQAQGLAITPSELASVPLPQNALEPVKQHKLDASRLPSADWPGVLMFGGVEVPCYVLSDGRRVISRVGATEILTGIKGGGDLEKYVAVKALVKYIPEDLAERMIEFTIPGVKHKTVKGVEASTFIDVCRAFVAALDAKELDTERQREIATKAATVVAACAKSGLDALIDEATGFQYARDEQSLQLKLKLYLSEEMRQWEPTFPEQLWREFGRLTKWKGPIHQRPKYWGKLVMQLIYDYLDPDVANWLRANAPKPKKGQNYHQWLSGQFGLKRLLEHIWLVIGMASSCYSIRELEERLGERFGRRLVQKRFWM